MNLKVSLAPHIHDGESTRRIMGDVLIALVPCTIMGLYRFGLQAALLLAVCMVTCLAAEWLWCKAAKREMAVGDLSALVTGLILGLNLPASAPWWVAVIGSVIAIILVKQLFGGIGHNFLNPAMAARALLLVSWPAHMARFILPLNSFAASAADAVTGATPLATGSASYLDLFLGNIPGTIGEISAMMILVGFLYLLIRKVITPIIPLVMVASTALFTLLFGGDPLYAILSGGLLFGAVFMATDYSTNPMTIKGQVLFAAGAGLIVAVIRRFGIYPEGVTYGILIMNILTPLIDKYTKPRVFGHNRAEKGVAKNG